MSQLLQYVGSCLGKYHLYTLYCVHLWMFWKNSKHFLDFKWGALFNLIDLNSTEFPCFEKVHPSPISLIFPSRSFLHQTTNRSDENDSHIAQNFPVPLSERSATEAQFLCGGHFKEETEWKKSACHVLVKERWTFGKNIFLVGNTAFSNVLSQPRIIFPWWM